MCPLGSCCGIDNACGTDNTTCGQGCQGRYGVCAKGATARFVALQDPSSNAAGDPVVVHAGALILIALVIVVVVG